MNRDTVYLKLEQSISVKGKKVSIQDAGKVFCQDKTIEKELNQEIFYVIQGEPNSRHVISILKIYEVIYKRYPEITIVNLGEKDIIVENKPQPEPKKWVEYTKSIFIGLILLVGSAFTIMTFNTDVGVSEIFDNVYYLIMGQEKVTGSILEIAYCIGLPIGSMVFYNHFTRRAIHNDPTPVKIEMRKFEEDMNKTLIQNASREGKSIDAN